MDEATTLATMEYHLQILVAKDEKERSKSILNVTTVIKKVTIQTNVPIQRSTQLEILMQQQTKNQLLSACIQWGWFW
jgi:hypothetical protein